MNTESEIVSDVSQAFKVRCPTKKTVEEVKINNPAWERCPICGRTRKECHFIYSATPITA